MTAVEALESNRVDLQQRLDAAKEQAEKNRLGQFATPAPLALDILRYAKPLLPDGKVRFLDPAFGTGSFYSALLRTFSEEAIEEATGFEIDQPIAHQAKQLWCGTPLRLHVRDFTTTSPLAQSQRATLLICNPPYVRHHHLPRDEKLRLSRQLQDLGLRISGLAGLYCYFLLLSDAWMAPNGIAGWLIPSEFMDVNYGSAVKDYLLNRVTLLRIHRFDPADVQFEDALVSSAIVWFQNAKPPRHHAVEFTFGGTLAQPRERARVEADALRRTRKWTKFPRGAATDEGELPYRLGDLFDIKRGLATGANEFFILTVTEAKRLRLPQSLLVPVLPSPRSLQAEEIHSDDRGFPLMQDQRVLLDCNLPPATVQREHPALWTYLAEGEKAGVAARYLCRHRDPWYSQEKRPPAPLLCTYMGRSTRERGNPFRFILNHSDATATNVYLMLYPKPRLAALLKQDPGLLPKVWQALTSITAGELTGEGRVYGGGLHKMEPRELSNLPADKVLAALPLQARPRRGQQARLPGPPRSLGV